jgi:hypothetical protein
MLVKIGEEKEEKGADRAERYTQFPGDGKQIETLLVSA